MKEQQKYIIRKAKVKDASAEVSYEILNEDGYRSEIVAKHSYPPHKDLLEAFGILRKHLVCLCDLREADLIHAEGDMELFDHEKLDKFTVTSFTIGGYDEYEGVVITGQKRLKSGKVLNLNTPFSLWMDENDPYEYEDCLYNDVARCIFEVEEYLNGKTAIKQLEMQFEPAEAE